MRIYTIGHSNHTAQAFVALLARHAVACLADVRSVPYSRHWPQFQRRALSATLSAAGIRYVFLGRELGARREDPEVQVDGRADYDRIAETALFHAGLTHLRALARDTVTAMMCAERAPLSCHRTVLIGRALQAHGTEVVHILADGSLEPHAQTEERLLDEMDLAESDLFAPDRGLRLADAYRRRGEALAYRPAREG